MEKIKNEFSKIWGKDEKMMSYLMKNCSNVYETEAGNLIEFEKQDIKKRFCFGHGVNGVTTQEDTNSACNMAQHARTSEEYFIKENLGWYNELKETLEEEKLFLMPQYSKTSICSIKTENYFWHYERERERIVETLSEKDIEGLKAMLEVEKEKFMKRLNTYLKRYGLSKVHSWTYLVD